MVVRQPETSEPLKTTLIQLDATADRLDLDDGIRAMLRACKRELSVHFTVHMDEGGIRVFTGYRVQHNLARGPAKAAMILAVGRVVEATEPAASTPLATRDR